MAKKYSYLRTFSAIQTMYLINYGKRNKIIIRKKKWNAARSFAFFNIIILLFVLANLIYHKQKNSIQLFFFCQRGFNYPQEMCEKNNFFFARHLFNNIY